MSDPKAPSSNPKQAYVTAALVFFGALFIGLVVLPRLSPGNAGGASQLLKKEAPDFVLEVIHQGDPGNRIRLSDLRGKAVILDFWASWCVPCRVQAPILDGVAKEYTGRPVHVVGVNTGDDRESAVEFAQNQKLGYASVLDADGAVARQFGVGTLPTLIILDAEGQVRFVRSGVVGEREIKAVLDGL